MLRPSFPTLPRPLAFPLTRPSLRLKKLRSRLMLRTPFPILQRPRPLAFPLTRPNLQLKPWRSRLLQLLRPLNLLARSLTLLLLRIAPTLLRSPATLKYNPRPLLTILTLTLRC
jgi:hypothetical protein